MLLAEYFKSTLCTLKEFKFQILRHFEDPCVIFSWKIWLNLIPPHSPHLKLRSNNSNVLN